MPLSARREGKMKLNGTPRHYMPLSQSQSDDEDNGSKTVKRLEKCCKNSELSDNFKILKLPKQNKKDKCSPMSPWRTVAFSFSLCMCVVFIAAFLFLVPCRPEALGVGNIGDLLEKWTVTLQNISLSSNVALAVTSRFSSPLLIFGYLMWENSTFVTKGVIAIQKFDGKEIWKIPLHSEVTSVLCNSIDVNSDGINDCLITGKNGLLTAIDIQKGTNVWYIHSHKVMMLPVNISNHPMLLPDCDDDGVSDLAVSYMQSENENSVSLMLVSGAKGEVIGYPIQLLHCTSPIIGHSAINMINKTGFLFYCHSGKAGQLFLSFFKDMCDVAYNKTDSMRMTVLHRFPESIPSELSLGFQILSTSLGDFIVLTGGSEICVLSEKNGKIKVVWQKSFRSNSICRLAAYGSFLERTSSELVFLATNRTVSQVIGLDIRNGKEMWSGTFNNTVITSVLTVSKFFRDDDGIILRLLKQTHKRLGNNLEFLDGSVWDIMNDTSMNNSNNFENFHGSIEESFVLVHVKDLPRAKIISFEEIGQNCTGSLCEPDIYSYKNTAVAETLSTGEVDVSIASASAVQRNSSVPWRVRTLVKLLKIEKFSKFSCMYSLDS